MHTRLFILLLSILSIGCEKISPFISDALWGDRMDVDHDGIPRPDDCDDRNASIKKRFWYRDLDHDGFGAGEKIEACNQPAETTITNNDCDDTRTNVYPNTSETCDGLDNDCNGQTDETFPNLSAGCGTGMCSGGTIQCSPDHLKTICSTDNNKSTEICDGLDNDCNGKTDETFPTLGASCGLGTCSGGTVLCTNDHLNTFCSTENNKSTEICDGLDNDCNGQTDEGLKSTFYADVDQDGFGDAGTKKLTCTPLSHDVTNTLDCDDTNASVYPNAPEFCNGLDDDCNGKTDEATAIDAKTWYTDSDQDGFGYALTTKIACTKPVNCVENKLDCNDDLASISPIGKELCNTVDDNCNEQTDEGVQIVFYADVDQDGYGNPFVTKNACSAPSGNVENSDDCNDLDKLVHPNAFEKCNNVDDNCNGQTDEGVLITYYLDSDTDGYGDLSKDVTGCTTPNGYVTNGDDCNDGKKTVHPNAVELCDNKIDENCDSITDNAIEANLWYLDADKDGYGTSAVSIYACATPTGFATNKTDCDDANPLIHPNAIEICKDGIDNDCNDITDTDTKIVSWYLDTDKDGFGDTTQSKQDCSQPLGYVDNATDCSDANASIHPGALEICNNGVDDNCDGSVNQCVWNGKLSIQQMTNLLLEGDKNFGFGETVAVCDLNQDGFEDMIVGSPSFFTPGNSKKGKISVYLGPLKEEAKPSMELEGQANSRFGASLACFITATGKAWVAISAPGSADVGENQKSNGNVYIFKNALLKSTTIQDADLIVSGSMNEQLVGSSLTFIADQTQDGNPELMIGATGYPNAFGSIVGATLLFDGSKSGLLTDQNALAKLIGTQLQSATGAVCASASLNKDADIDFLIAAPKSNVGTKTNAGSLFVQLGPLVGNTNLDKPLMRIDGTTTFGNTGASFCSGFDFTGDAIQDIVIASPGDDSKQVAATISFFSTTKNGNLPLSDAQITLSSTNVGDHMGRSISCDDLNKDGIGDLLIGIPGSPSLQAPGQLAILYGPITKNTSLQMAAAAFILGDQPSGAFGWIVRSVPDMTGDGIADVLITTKYTTPGRHIYLVPGIGL